MNKKRVLIVFVFVTVLVISGYFIFMPEDKNDDGYNIAAQALDIEFNADIMVYGENPNFRDTVKYRNIDKITEETLNCNEEHGYRAIVIFDHNGTVSISDEELLLIKEYVEEKGYDIHRKKLSG